MEDFYLRREKEKAPESVCFRGFSGAVGGIRTLVPLLTTTRFPVVLVMTSSIPLHIQFADKQHRLLYQKCVFCQDGIFRGRQKIWRAGRGLHNLCPPVRYRVLLQSGADLVHGLVQSAGQAVHGFAGLRFPELGRGAEGCVQQDAGGHTDDHAAHKCAYFHDLSLLFRLGDSLPAGWGKMRKYRRCFLPNAAGALIIYNRINMALRLSAG